jgi:hypothetical protein
VVPVRKKIHAAGKGMAGRKLIGEGRRRNDDARRNESVKFVPDPVGGDILNVGLEKIEEVDDYAARVRRVPMAA